MGDVYDAARDRDYAVGHDWPKEDRPKTSGFIQAVETITKKALYGPSRADLPNDPAARKEVPIVTGVLDYFPDAIAEVARVSFAGNQQHNPGQPLHWAREKSTDHEDCIGRHTLQRGTRDTDGQRHTAKRAWRALAALQIEIEEERKRGVLGTVSEQAGQQDFSIGGGMAGCGTVPDNCAQYKTPNIRPDHVFNGRGKV